jgi:hypothetical protein
MGPITNGEGKREPIVVGIQRGDEMQLSFLELKLSKEAKRKAERLMSRYKMLEAIIESRRIFDRPILCRKGVCENGWNSKMEGDWSNELS